MVNHAATPEVITARAYDVGFGDCLLLTVHYDPADLADDTGRSVRHILVDFGSTRYPYRGFKMTRVADLIRDQIRHDAGIAVGAPPVLDVVIATHRHKDHISGFDEQFSGDEIATLNPRFVIRPWPDHPDATNAERGPIRLTDADREFAHQLRGVDTFARAASEEFSHDRGRNEQTLHRLADIGLANAAAISNLERWARRGHGEYVAAGDEVIFDGVAVPVDIPGVFFDVLGPPTIQQAPKLERQRANDQDEYWFRAAGQISREIAGAKRFSDDVYARLAEPDGIGAAAWLMHKLERRSVAQLLRIVQSFDDALNNTSVVGILRTDRTKILISGDAQIENWQYTLDRITPEDQRDADAERPMPDYDDNLRDALIDVSLYKVGHHGSRNGTPKSLYGLWESHDRNGRTQRLAIVNSTKPGVHSHTPTTAVPSPALEAGLQDLKGARYYSTQYLRPDPQDPDTNPYRIDDPHRSLVGATTETGRFGRFRPETPY